jgi:hypothetical protein
MDWYQPIIWSLIIICAVYLDIRLMRYLRINKQNLEPVTFFGRPLYLLGIVYTHTKKFRKGLKNFSFHLPVINIRQYNPSNALQVSPLANQDALVHLKRLLPVMLIVGWALWVGRGYINFDPTHFPNGGDFPLQIFNHYGWNSLKECGLCVLWNGTINGGHPTFAEVQGASLHPVIVGTTLVWGVINGAKVTLIISLVTLGHSLWWLTRVMGLSPMAGIWAAGMAIAGGHIGDRMGGGMMNIVFSLANASLILPPLVDLLYNGNKRSTIWISIFLTLTMLSGQGYIQLSILLGLAPAVLLCSFTQRKRLNWIPSTLFFSLVLTVLLSAVLWIPVLHFSPYVTKYGDSNLANALDFGIAPLKLLLIEDKSLFIGWIPILLALSTLHLVPQEKKKLMWLFFLAITLIFFTSSSTFLKFALKYVDQIGLLRFPDNMAMLTVPLILALGAWGLDLILKKPITLSLIVKPSEVMHFHYAWVLFPAILFLSLQPVYKVSQWRFDTHAVERPEAIMKWLETESSELVHLPTPDFDWMPIALDRGFKLTGVYRPWFWKERDQPLSHKEVDRNEREDSALQMENLFLVYRDGVRYAAVSTLDGGLIPCQAYAIGGHIDVTCTQDRPGTLIVMENSFSGWVAQMDGKPIPLYRNQWLKVDAPAGHHTYSFRYRPWDVWLGMGLSLLGILIAIFAWRRDRTQQRGSPTPG